MNDSNELLMRKQNTNNPSIINALINIRKKCTFCIHKLREASLLNTCHFFLF